MNVAWITSTYPWVEEPVGGIFFRNQAQALARRGVGVTMVTPTPWAPFPLSMLRRKWRLYARTPERADDGNVRVVRPRYLNVPGQPAFARADELIAGAAMGSRRHWSAARLIHGHYAVTGLAAARVAKASGLPLVLSFHGSDINTWPSEHPNRIDDLTAALREAALVTAVSRPLVDRIRELAGVDAVHLPVGCDLRLITDNRLPRREARRVVRLPNDRVIVLFVGNLLRSKGVHVLVNAILALGHPFLAVLLGDGPEAGYGSSDPRAGDLLDYRGQRKNEDVINHMAAADVLLLPSYGEGLPTVLVEAGAVGLPVIASSVGGIPDLLAEDRGMLLPEITEQAVAHGLTDFVAQREDSEAAAARLQRYVREEHEVNHNAGRLLDLYRAAISRH